MANSILDVCLKADELVARDREHDFAEWVTGGHLCEGGVLLRWCRCGPLVRDVRSHSREE